MTKIIVSILTFLLMIFPNSKMLLAPYQSMTYPGEKVIIEEVMSAIEARNITALKDMMCKNIKNSVPNLTGKIGELIDCIDGDITKFEQIWGNAYYAETKSSGKKISQVSFAISITTSTKAYHLSILWEYVNNFSKDERGIRRIGIAEQGQSEYMYTISATNGIFDWHD